MTTPDTPRDPNAAVPAPPSEPLATSEFPATDPTSAAPTTESTSPGRAHSAPRPVPPGLAGDGEAPVGETTSGPTRVSAFPAFDRGGSAATSASMPETTPVPAAPSSSPAALTTPVPAPATNEVTTTRVVPAGTSVPLADPDSLAGSTAGRLKTETREPFPDSEWVEKPTKRTAAHLWGVLATLVLAPIAWFLLADGAQRTYYSLMEIGDSANLAGLLSLGGGLVALVVLALVARASSLGAWIWGGLIAAAGATFLAIPQTAMQWLADSRESFLTVHEGFGTNLYNYLLDSGRSGLLLTFGVILLLFAVVAHSARRSGRTEGRIRAEAAARGE